MFLLIYFLFGVAYALFAVRHMKPDDIELIRDESMLGAILLLGVTLCWPVLAVGSLLRLLDLCMSRQREGDDDDSRK